MRRHKLTKAGRIVIFLLVAAIVIGVGGFAYTKMDMGSPMDIVKDILPEKDSSTDSGASEQHTSVNLGKLDSKDETINLSLDEWIGWKPIIDANQGLTTQPGSIFDKLGLKVNINVVNDAEASSNALIKGDLNAAGYTTNRTAFLSGKFKDAGLRVVMPVFTNYSDGGDGIIAMNGINNIEDLVSKKIGVPKYSEAQTLVIWFVNKSDLPDSDKKQIIDNLILMDDPEQCGQAFFAGKLDVAATWQPFLSNAEDSTNSHILFSTAASNKLIMDGIVFRSDFAEAHPDVVSKFIDGIFQAESMYETEFEYIRKVMPMFADSSDQDIKDMCGDAGLMGYSENKVALEDDALTVYTDMCDIWEAIGESVDRASSVDLFDSSYLMALSDKYSSLATKKAFEITEKQKQTAKDSTALLSKSTMVTFVPNTAKFMNAAEADSELKEFVEIAKTLDGAIIQIEGNINSRNGVSGGQELSEQRAKTVAKYLIANGIDANRIITVGNDNKKPIVDPDAPDCEKNRRTDVFFKVLES